MHLFWSQSLSDIHHYEIIPIYRLCPHALNWRVYTTSINCTGMMILSSLYWKFHNNEDLSLQCVNLLLSKWLEMITTMHSITKKSPWKSERESFFFWIVPFMVCCLYEWMTSTRAVTCTSAAVDKWFAMYPSVFIVVLVRLFLFFAFIVTIQITLLLGYQVWGEMKVVYKFHRKYLQKNFRKFLFRCLGWFSMKSLEVLYNLTNTYIWLQMSYSICHPVIVKVWSN